MKYKDLNIGDWFLYENKPCVKTFCRSLSSHYDFCLDPSSVYFGHCFKALENDTEVEFLPRLNINNPYPQKRTTVNTKAPLYQFLSWQFNKHETILIKALIQGTEYTMALYSDTYETGIWETISSPVPVKIVPRIDVKYQENT